MVPVGHKNICVTINVATVRGAENGRWHAVRTDLIVSPLALLGVVADESDRHIVLVNNRDPPLQLRDNRIVPMEADLAWTPQMLRHVADKLAVIVEMAEPEVFPIAYEKKRLLIAGINRQSVATVAFSVFVPLPAKLDR